VGGMCVIAYRKFQPSGISGNIVTREVPNADDHVKS
jgi:hypothetical protein